MTALERIRLTKRLTRTQLSERADVHVDTIKRIEDGKGMSDAVLFKLADALECEPLELRESTARAVA